MPAVSYPPIPLNRPKNDLPRFGGAFFLLSGCALGRFGVMLSLAADFSPRRPVTGEARGAPVHEVHDAECRPFHAVVACRRVDRSRLLRGPVRDLRSGAQGLAAALGDRRFSVLRRRRGKGGAGLSGCHPPHRICRRGRPTHPGPAGRAGRGGAARAAARSHLARWAPR